MIQEKQYDRQAAIYYRNDYGTVGGVFWNNCDNNAIIPVVLEGKHVWKNEEEKYKCNYSLGRNERPAT